MGPRVIRVLLFAAMLACGLAGCSKGESVDSNAPVANPNGKVDETTRAPKNTDLGLSNASDADKPAAQTN